MNTDEGKPSKRWFLSGDFIGAVIGLFAAPCVCPPRMTLSETGIIIWILGGAAIGAVIGRVLEAIVRRGK